MVKSIGSKLLNISMNGIDVGKLEKTKTGALFFNYSESWLNTPSARPISLSLPLVDIKYSGDKVYNFFDNLLPDNPNIRQRIQAKFKAQSNHPFDLLKCVGKDCVGALQISDNENSVFEQSIIYKPANEKKIANILRSYEVAPLGMLDELDDFRLSLAGAQEKSAFLYHNKKWCIPQGQTPTTHIFKLPIGMIPHQQLDLSDSCENEWLCAKIAKEFGFPVATSQIHFFEDVKVLVVERFDRKLSSDKSWIMRLPQEDMCQALGYSSNLKYQSDGGPGIKNIMHILLGSEDPTYARDMFFKTQILFWLLGAIDGHAKNFSIFIKPQGRFEPTPLYDIMSAFPLIENKQLSDRKIKMAMGLQGKTNHYQWFQCRRTYFTNTAKNCGYSSKNVDRMIDELLMQVDKVIEAVKDQIPVNFNLNVACSIFDGMYKMRERLLIKK